MKLERIFLLIEFGDPARVAAFLSSDDVRRAKFGDKASAPGQSAQVQHLIQPDGFRIMATGSQLHANYSLPRDVSDVEEDPFSHLGERFRRFIRSVANIGDGKAKWIGLQVFFEDPLEGTGNADAALERFVGTLRSPIFSEAKPAHLSLSVGFERNRIFETVTIQAYETRVGSFEPGTVDPALIAQSQVVAAGMQYIIDMNTKPRTPERVDKLHTELSQRLKDGYLEIIERGKAVLLGKSVHVG